MPNRDRRLADLEGKLKPAEVNPVEELVQRLHWGISEIAELMDFLQDPRSKEATDVEFAEVIASLPARVQARRMREGLDPNGDLLPDSVHRGEEGYLLDPSEVARRSREYWQAQGWQLPSKLK